MAVASGMKRGNARNERRFPFQNFAEGSNGPRGPYRAVGVARAALELPDRGGSRRELIESIGRLMVGDVGDKVLWREGTLLGTPGELDLVSGE